MSFSNMLEILQAKNKGKIVLVKLGVFYIATGKDAVLLNNKLNLKCTCFKKGVCKVGIPVNSLEKYIDKLEKTMYSYVIYDYDKENNEIKEIIRRPGRVSKITNKNINCFECKKIIKNEDNSEYAKALNKLLKKEEQ